MKLTLRPSQPSCPAGARSSGYTLIELLIVVAVLGLASALLIPSLRQPDTLKIQAAVRRIIGDLSFAQSDALAQQELRRVYFYADGRGYVILRDPFDPATDYIDDPLARGFTNRAYIVDFTVDGRFEGITVLAVNIDGGARFITYDELAGTVTPIGDPGTGGSITVESLNARYRIDIAPFTGKLTVVNLTP